MVTINYRDGRPIYEQVKDDVLPPLENDETLEKVKLEGKQHFTEPPLRYSEARLIKELEEKIATVGELVDFVESKLD